MFYKVVKGDTLVYSNSDGKKNASRPFIGVGIFENIDSQTYTLLCTMSKVDDAYFEASRIAELLNKNNTLFSKKEIEDSQSRYHPLMEAGNS